MWGAIESLSGWLSVCLRAHLRVRFRACHVRACMNTRVRRAYFPYAERVGGRRGSTPWGADAEGAIIVVDHGEVGLEERRPTLGESRTRARAHLRDVVAPCRAAPRRRACHGASCTRRGSKEDPLEVS